MFFPQSGVETALWLPPLVALVISFFTSMGGVSGAFLLLPFQVSVLHYTAPSVSATNQVFNLVAIPSGVLRYIREGRMVWPLTWAVISGTLPGVFLGAWIRVAWLPDPRVFKLFVGMVLLYIGTRMVQDILQREERGKAGAAASRGGGRPLEVQTGRITLRRVEYVFEGRTYGFSPAGVLALCFAVGVVGGTYGIGGGSIVAPFLVAILKLPVYTVAGAALMGTFITSLAGVAFYHVLAIYHPAMSVAPDWLLGALFGAGGILGMYLGARCQKYFPPRIIKGILCACILFVAVKYGVGFFLVQSEG